LFSNLNISKEKGSIIESIAFSTGKSEEDLKSIGNDSEL